MTMMQSPPALCQLAPRSSFRDQSQSSDQELRAGENWELRELRIAWWRVKGWPHFANLRRQRGNVPDCDLLMVWRLFASISLMEDFSRAVSRRRGRVAGIWVLRGLAHTSLHTTVHTCNHTLLLTHIWIPLHPSPSHSSNQSTTELANVNSVTKVSKERKITLAYFLPKVIL